MRMIDTYSESRRLLNFHHHMGSCWSCDKHMQELGSTLAQYDMLVQLTLHALMTLHVKQALLICL